MDVDVSFSSLQSKTLMQRASAPVACIAFEETSALPALIRATCFHSGCFEAMGSELCLHPKCCRPPLRGGCMWKAPKPECSAAWKRAASEVWL